MVEGGDWRRDTYLLAGAEEGAPPLLGLGRKEGVEVEEDMDQWRQGYETCLPPCSRSLQNTAERQ